MQIENKKPKVAQASEHQEQVALMAWAALAMTTRPELALLVAVPNGGLRHIAVAAKLKREGVSAGFPDLALPVRRGEFGGLFIELKTAKGVVSPAQAAWIARLNAHGQCAVVCRGWLAARRVVESYLDGRFEGLH